MEFVAMYPGEVFPHIQGWNLHPFGVTPKNGVFVLDVFGGTSGVELVERLVFRDVVSVEWALDEPAEPYCFETFIGLTLRRGALWWTEVVMAIGEVLVESCCHPELVPLGPGDARRLFR